MRKNPAFKILACLLFPPAFFVINLEFKTREELQLMPQTEEEWQVDLRRGGADSDSDTSSSSSSSSSSSAATSRRSSVDGGVNAAQVGSGLTNKADSICDLGMGKVSLLYDSNPRKYYYTHM